MTERPVIGISLDWAESGSFSARPHYALREHYFQAVEAAGGRAIGLPRSDLPLSEALHGVDGLLIPGGGFASPPDWYADPEEPAPYEESPRLAHDLKLIEHALQTRLPMLGICAGMQLLAGVLGCRMTRNVMNFTGTDIDHWGAGPAEDPVHDIWIEPESRLAGICGDDPLPVNTAHREAVVAVPPDVIISARSPDGVIEAIEAEQHPHAIGVQWHPEFHTTLGDRHLALFQWLVQAAKS
ncbi:MAG: gamma-glutamyl-gamma-aminobutyrate hydrolase family protein [Alphaproteobacteria bacterium]